MGYRIPRHIKPEDTSIEADAERLNHYQTMQSISGGAGFRKPSNNTAKKLASTRFNKIADRMMRKIPNGEE